MLSDLSRSSPSAHWAGGGHSNKPQPVRWYSRVRAVVSYDTQNDSSHRGNRVPSFPVDAGRRVTGRWARSNIEVHSVKVGNTAQFPGALLKFGATPP